MPVYYPQMHGIKESGKEKEAPSYYKFIRLNHQQQGEAINTSTAYRHKCIQGNTVLSSIHKASYNGAIQTLHPHRARHIGYTCTEKHWNADMHDHTQKTSIQTIPVIFYANRTHKIHTLMLQKRHIKTKKHT